jgi:hypothetical protein
VASPERQPGNARRLDALFPRTPAPSGKAESLAVPATASGLTALSIEFVAKPEKARSAPLSLPAAITESLQEVTGFIGCWVMVSDQEARLITVVTFWSGSEAQKFCTEKVKWVKGLLSTYLDSCLRIQTMYAHVPPLPSICREASAAGAGLMIGEITAQEETLASRSASY